MFRGCIKRTIILSTIFPFSLNRSDQLSGKTRTEQLVDEDELKPKETGWDRVKKIFQTDEFGNMSQELNSILYLSSLSIFVGAVYGGIMSTKTTYIDFIKNHQATAFKNHLDAKRKLHDAMTISFGKGAFRWAWRLTLFTTSFVGIYTIIQVYRNKCGMAEYIIAGGVSGFIYRFKMGPRGWIVGAGLGIALGFVGGGLTNVLLHLTGMSMQEARYWQNHWREQREQMVYKKAIEKREKETLLYEHNLKYQEKNQFLNSIDKQDNETNNNTK